MSLLEFRLAGAEKEAIKYLYLASPSHDALTNLCLAHSPPVDFWEAATGPTGGVGGQGTHTSCSTEDETEPEQHPAATAPRCPTC